jgi:amino acid permease
MISLDSVGVWTSIFVREKLHLSSGLVLIGDDDQLTAAVFINLFPSRIYGEMEFWFSTLKVTTIVVISENQLKWARLVLSY